MKSLTTLIVLVFALTSCAELDFFSRRSFTDQMDRNDDPLFMPGEDFPVMAGDTGKQFRSRQEIIERTPPSGKTLARRKEKRSLEKELDRRINSLPERERDAFVQNEAKFENIYQKIYHLQLKTENNKEYSSSRRKRAPASTPLRLGMSKDSVLNHWGPPLKVEISGHPKLENERWTYYQEGKLRRIFFESGNIQGWSM